MLKFNLLSLFLVVSYAQYVMDGDVIVVDYDKLEIAIKEFPYLLLEAYSPKCSRCTQIAPHYATAATELLKSNIRLAKVDILTESGRKIANKLQLRGLPGLFFYRHGVLEIYSGGNTQNQIVEWCLQNAKPFDLDGVAEDKVPQNLEFNSKLQAERESAVLVLTDKTFKKLVIETTSIVFVKFYDPQCVKCQQLAPMWRLLAKNLGQIQNFKIAEIDMTVNKLPDLQITSYPTLMLFNNGKYINYEGKYTIRDFVTFMKTHKKQKVEANPAASTSSKVLVVTLDNYEEFVLNSQQDVLLEFYAPWCGHCKNLTPVYDELSLKVNNVIVAKVDATVHKLPGYEIKGYPTIKYLQKVNGKVETKDYTEARTLEGFLSFLNSQSKKQEDL